MLSHEEVVNQLDNDTVSYGVGLGVSDSFTDIFRVSIKVETAYYETAIAWLKDLVYGADFNKNRSIYYDNFCFMTQVFFETGYKLFWPSYSNLSQKEKEVGVGCLAHYGTA